jgi:hypothetical protein
VTVNRRGELWINTKEKPRAAFRVVKGNRVEAGEVEKTDGGSSPALSDAGPSGKGEERGRRSERGHRRSEAEQAPASDEPAQPLPAGTALLDRLVPLMRRNRRGEGISGSTSFLARALRCTEADLMNAFTALGLTLAADPTAEPATIEFSGGIWWLNQDQRGGVWINGREKSDDRGQPSERGDSPATEGSQGSASDPAASNGQATNAAAAPLTAVRLLLKPTKTGAFADETGRLAETLGKSPEEFLATLVGAGLKVPDKPREKPVFVEHAGEIFWLNKSPKDELWLNAKPSKYSDGDSGRRGPRSRGGKNAEAAPSNDAPPAEGPAASGDQAG